MQTLKHPNRVMSERENELHPQLILLEELGPLATYKNTLYMLQGICINESNNTLIKMC